MKFLVTCLDDDMRTRILATRSQVFDSVPAAIKYSNSVAGIRVPSIVPVASDAEHAAEFIFEYVVEKRPDLIEDGDPEVLKGALRYDIAGNDYMVVFAPGNDIASAFLKADMLAFSNELERLILEV